MNEDRLFFCLFSPQIRQEGLSFSCAQRSSGLGRGNGMGWVNRWAALYSLHQTLLIHYSKKEKTKTKQQRILLRILVGKIFSFKILLIFLSYVFLSLFLSV